MPALWLADALRAGGLTVDESLVPDWRDRGHTDGPRLDDVRGVLGHHTAGPRTGDYPSLGTVRDGRPDLAGPLANLGLTRAGVWVPIAAGRAWHAGAPDRAAAWPWVPNGDGNGYLIGVEAESCGLVDDWTPEQREAYPRGVAALLRYRGLLADRFLGHKEWAPRRKPDPAYWDMGAFRQAAASWLGDPAPTPAPAPAPPAIPPVPGLPGWSLPAGHYYGNLRGPAASHGGYYPAERPAVQAVQRRLIAAGCVPGVTDWRNGWADGRWEDATDAACRRWFAAHRPGQPYTDRVYRDDYAVLGR